MKKIILLSLILLLILKANAQTYVSGGIYSNTTWTKAAGPYIVTDTVFVFPGVILTIEPGVTVKFNDNKMLEIREASLIAEGTNIDSITFTSNSTTPIEGSWGSVSFLNGGLNSKLKYCNFKYAQKGVQVGSYATIFINKSSFEENEIGIGQGSGGAGSLRIDSTNFGHNKYFGIAIGSARTRMYFNYLYVHHNNIGIEGSDQAISEPDRAKRDWYIKNSIIDSNYKTGLRVWDHLKIENCHIGYNKIGYEGTNNSIKNCVFEYNSEIGFQAGDDSLFNCKIYHNKDGIFAKGFGYYLEGNEITNNDIGINIDYNKTGFIFGNVISNNRIGIDKLGKDIIVKYNSFENDSIGITSDWIENNVFCNKFCGSWVYDLEYTGKVNVNVANNYWCTVDSLIVVSRIFDGYDDPTYGLAFFMPIDTTCYKTLGVKDLKQNQQTKTKFYPNPFSTSAALEFDNPQGKPHQLSVYNALGQLVIQIENIKSNKLTIERKELQTGLYFYQLRNEDGIAGSGKIMIE